MVAFSYDGALVRRTFGSAFRSVPGPIASALPTRPARVPTLFFAAFRIAHIASARPARSAGCGIRRPWSAESALVQRGAAGDVGLSAPFGARSVGTPLVGVGERIDERAKEDVGSVGARG